MSLCVQFSRGPQGTDLKVLFFDCYQTYQHGSQDWWWLSQCSPQAATGHLPSISSQYQLPCQMLSTVALNEMAVHLALTST